MKKVTCVYMIRSISEPDRFYVGGTTNYESRVNSHLQVLRRYKHHSQKLTHHVFEYGINDLVFSIIEKCDADTLPQREQFWIIQLNPYFNTKLTAGDKRFVGCTYNDIVDLGIGFERFRENEVRLYCDRDFIPETIIQLRAV